MRLAIRQLGSEPPDMTASVSRRQVRVSMENIFCGFLTIPLVQKIMNKQSSKLSLRYRP